jgi:maleylpyruvate isomerase
VPVTLRPGADIDGAVRSHARLLATVDGLDDDTAARPSLLPGWSVAMLVTHLARNAEGHAFVAEGARVGERRRRYPSVDARDAGIEAGRGRTADEVRADLGASVDRLEAAWAAMPAEAWSVVGLSATGQPEPLQGAPRSRWRESEIHHADLGLGFGAEDWDPVFVELELAHWGADLAARVATGPAIEVVATDTGARWAAGEPAAATRIEAPAWALLAWLTGRRTDGFPPVAPWNW